MLNMRIICSKSISMQLWMLGSYGSIKKLPLKNGAVGALTIETCV
jgi:hypothetical protein